MMQVSRKNGLKIPKQIIIYETNVNSINDAVGVKKSFALANNKKFDEETVTKMQIKRDEGLKTVSKIPSNSSDLMVITVVKKLGAYIITVTEKSPKKFRGVFVNRMQNYCLDTLEYLLESNFIRMDSLDKKKLREDLQKKAIVKLKLLGYVAMVAENANCLLKNQYKQISMQLAEAINLIVAWKKSDDARWKSRNEDFKSKGF